MPKGSKKYKKEKQKPIRFKNWAQARREKRDSKGKKPWKGIFIDPVKLSVGIFIYT